MRLIFLTVCAVFSVLTGLSQVKTVTGTVKDLSTGAPLGFCSVIPVGAPGHGTLANADGTFLLTFPDSARVARVSVSLLGYRTDTVMVDSDSLIIRLSEQKTTLDEIVISGGTKATIIRENPLAIELVSAREINRTPEANLIESLSRHVPGLTTVTTGPNISKPFIRGLGYNRVLTLYDGFRQEGQQWGDEHGLEVDNYNIERAEVIKGPASLLYGSDAVAGVVSLYPATPREKEGKLHGQFLTEFQSNNGLLGNALRLNSGAKYFFWSAGGSLRKARNYTNRIDGPVYNTGFDEKNLSGLLGFTNSKGESRFNFTLYDDRQGIPDGSRDSLTRKFTRQIFEGADDHIKERPVVSESEMNSYALSPLHQHIRHYRLYSNHQYKAGAGDVNLQLGVQQNIRQEFTHPTAPAQAGLSVRLNTMNYGVRYNAPAFAGIELTGGFNGMLQQNKNNDATDFPIPDYRLRDAGGFGFVTWKKRRFTTSGGVRYDTRSITSGDFYVRRAQNGFSEQANPPDTAGAVLQSAALNQHFNGVSLSLGTAIRLSEGWSVKVNVARGYRAPNIAEIASNGLDPGAHIVYVGNRNFNPEFSFQQDIGITGDFDDIAVSFNIFNNNLRDYIYLSQVVDAQGNPVELVQGNKTFQYLQSSARLFGGEASFELHPRALKGFGWTNSFSVVYGNNTSAAFHDKGVNGQYLPFIPPLKITSSLRYELRTTSGLFPALTAGADLDYTAAQNRYLALYATETRTGGYGLVNFSVGADLRMSKGSMIHFQAQVNNVFDAAWQSNLSRLKYFEYYKASPNGHLGMYGMGRNICLKVTIPF